MNEFDISVVLSTRNRAEILRQTLEQMARMDFNALNVQFIIVDNGSNDHTKSVVNSFTGKLSIFYLFESIPGKNRALNRALDEVPLGNIVVFTDDDVDPDRNWLRAIFDISKRWPDHSVFGGRIYIVWPYQSVPDWVNDPFIRVFGFASHDHSQHEQVYEGKVLPFGANFWIRRHILDDGERFNEIIGPRPSNRIMGGESDFLRRIRDKGFQAVYSPHAVIGHRIQREMISVTGIRKRAFRLGRSSAHLYGLTRSHLLKRNPIIWRIHRVTAIIKYSAQVILSMLLPFHNLRVILSVKNIYTLAAHIASLSMVRDNRYKTFEG